MYLLLHILYTFRTLPLPILSTQLAKLQATLVSFIWNDKRSKLKCHILCTPSKSARMGAPDIATYYKATILDQSKAWWSPTQVPTWLQIERAALSTDPKIFLGALLLQLQPSCSFLDTINATIRTWKSLLQQTQGIPRELLSHMPLSSLELLILQVSLTPWTTAGTNTIGNLFTTNHLSSFQHLCQQYQLNHRSFYMYLQICSALSHTQWTNQPLFWDLVKFCNQPIF